MATVAFIGLGRMGGNMAGHVVRAGHEVRVFDVRRDAMEPLIDAGAELAESAGQAALGADYAAVAVLNDEQFIAVVLGDDGVLSTMDAGGVLLAHSTLEPTTVRQVARACSEAGVAYIDAPMSGGVPGAKEGSLMIIAGGEVDDIERARPVLDAYSTRIVHCGPISAGTYAKLGRNAVGYILMSAVAEGMALAVRGGVEASTFTHILEDSDVLLMYESAKMVAGGETVDYDPESHGDLREVITTCHKDLRQAIVAAQGFDLAMPAARGTMDSYGTVFGIDLPPSPDLLDGLAGTST